MKTLSTILIIDDDDLFSESLSDFLSGKGFEVETALNGKDGMARFERDQPPLVLLDQELPDTGGIDVCRKILEINANTKIIFITAYPSIAYAVDAMRAGAFNYISKPFELDELLIVIDMAVRNMHLEGKVRVQNYAHEKERKEKRLVGSSEVMKRIREQISLAAGADMWRVFVPLFTTRPGGMGMGLPIARRPVFRMGAALPLKISGAGGPG